MQLHTRFRKPEPRTQIQHYNARALMHLTQQRQHNTNPLLEGVDAAAVGVFKS